MSHEIHEMRHELERLVREMRKAQIAFFTDRSAHQLNLAKRLEKDVDDLLLRLTKAGHPSLF